MAYTTYYGVCLDDLDPHYEPGCDYVPEKARIRRGAWVHRSAYPTLAADPITQATWAALIAAGTVVIMPELSGSFDGGSPVMAPGFGDEKEVYTGSNFKATIRDRVYKENWAHYRSMAGKTSWHFAYLTESLVHITEKAVTVAPKNPITDNIDDSVIWEADITWFQFFTPAPHVAPMAVFLSGATPHPTFDTAISRASGSTTSSAGVTVNSTATSGTAFKFNAASVDGTGSSATMNVMIAGTQVAQVVYTDEANGDACAWVSGGVTYYGTFGSGNRTFAA